MNLDELDNSATDSDSGHSIDPETSEHRNRHSPQEGSNPSSIPFDPEWVSPFTLPPLPALRKNRGQSKLLRSPEERLHQRSSSSAYYAAAWGSPYATPSPNRSPQPRLRRKSQDPETASPLSARTREFAPETTGLRISSRASSAGRRARSWDRSKSLSERFNWLSESDLSGGEADVRAQKTPTRDTYLKSLKASVDKVKVPRVRTHQLQESLATITPENFNATEDQLSPVIDSIQVPQPTMEQAADERVEVHPSNGAADKPLPNLPMLGTAEKMDVALTNASPDSPTRPRMHSIQSFQWPKKKVVWKGKTCIIALPLTDRESAGLPPPLTFNDIRERMQKWAAEGYDVDGLKLSGPQDRSAGFVQSRSLYPDPQDMYTERKTSNLHVHIPDQGEWDAWVEYLKEEKLRALGVTPSNSEAPMSVQSPFSSTMSRVSSTYPSAAASPPIGTFSANGNPIRVASNTFSPPLSHPGGMRSHVASPSISGYPGPMHGYKHSIAQPRMTSPYDYPVSHPGSFGPGMRITPGAYGTRQFSPPTAANLQSLGQVLSPMIPTIPSNDTSYGTPQNPTMEQIHQQQLRQQQLHQHMIQHQRQYSYFPPLQSKSADNLPRTPTLESPSHRTPEIMHPTPRSHRHNLSAALQKGVDDAEASRTSGPTNPKAVKQQTDVKEDERTKAESISEEPEPELPVLKRPETLTDGDDRSDIETNPSIAASPLLIDNTNPFAAPFANLQQIQDALQSQSQHKANPSISKFNVEAPVFNPQAKFSSSNFTFGGQSFHPKEEQPTKPLVPGSRPSFTPKNVSISNLNVDAPAFTPSFMVQATPSKDVTPVKDTPAKPSTVTPSKSSFTFSSPSFNVDAPEFKPGQSFSFTADAAALPFEYQPSSAYEGSLFGNVTIDPNSKANRRGTKLVPIVPPESAEDKEIELADDDEGRVSAPSDRQKRARMFGDDKDDELLFADSAPFDHAQGLSSKHEESRELMVKDDASSSETVEVVETEADQKTLDSRPGTSSERHDMAQVEDQVKSDTEAAVFVIEDRSPSPEEATSNSDEECVEVIEDLDQWTPSPSEVIYDKAVGVAADAESDLEAERTQLKQDMSDTDGQVALDEDHETKNDLDQDPRSSPGGHQTKFSFSALAKPFEFRPTQPFAPQAAPARKFEPEPKAKRGLMASRFAAVSPEPRPVIIDRSPSPPEEMYEYIKPEDADLHKQAPPAVMPETQSPVFQPRSSQVEAAPQLTSSAEGSVRSAGQRRSSSHSISGRSRVDETMPSYEEIDAVMRQFEDNPDLGVEREDTPVKATPLIDMRLPATFRSDAPSPSPRRIGASPQRRADWGLGIHKLNDGNDQVSDWNDEFSPRQEDKLQSQAQFFDSRVDNLVGNLLENRLVPLEDSLVTIQQSLALLLDKKSRRSGRRSLSTENKAESDADDADDEDDYEVFEGISTYRSRSPSRNQRKSEKIRAIVLEAMAEHQPQIPEQPVIDMSEVHAALDEMRQLSQKVAAQSAVEQPNVRTIMEGVISDHPHFKALKRQAEHDAVVEAYQLKVDMLESSLKEAEQRVEQGLALRNQTDNDIKQLNQKLLEAEENAILHRKASEEAQSNMAALRKEKDAYHALQSEHADLLENNKALEDTLAEYRVTSDQFREEIKLERARNQDLIRRMHSLREDFNEKIEQHQGLRHKMEKLQDKMAQVMHDVHAEEAEWRGKEHDLTVQNKTIQAALDHEIRHREKIEIELDNLDREHKDNIRFRSQHEQAQHDVARLQSQITTMSEENKAHQGKAFKLEQELAYTKSVANDEVSKATAKMQSELEAARATIDSLETDAQAQISRLQKRLDDAELDLEEQKAKHDNTMAETHDAHNQALHEANQKRENALEEQHTSHERKLNDLRERHTRALHNSTDDRHRLEHQMSEKQTISEERVKHLESQVKDLEERLEISKSAARAAVEAATAKAVASVPTPAPSVMASPPHRLSSASMQLIRGTDIPEKISPQAMRESIIVLQDQLQNRELTIEKLESDIAAIDKEAPAKVKERDNEITLLRELLTVRVDDLDEIIATLAQPNFDREAAKNAAIRLKANLQMEQQLKERAATAGGVTSALPSISALSSFAQSPRGLPMAAAAAWGNWRKARDYGYSAVSDIASNISQTPSKSSPGSPSNLLAGIMTPPSMSQRAPSPSDANPLSPTIRPLAAAAAARKNGGIPSEARPLRTYSSQARTLSSRQAEKRRESNESSSPETASKRQPQPQPETPTTPLASRSIGSLDLGDDVDEDASPYTGSEHDTIDSPVAPKDVVSA